ncbi:MAG: hypothetical protein HUU47_10595 [Bacteroidetes bacterium]|nr:hypothetical protein [Bacteroidota bacterium]
MYSKFTFTLFTVMLLGFFSKVFAQAPQKLSYQAVIRNTGGALVVSSNIGMKVSILQGSASGTVLYSETYSPLPQTNGNGLVTVEIGSGVPSVGTFNGINWANGPIFIKVETDVTGGTSYTISGTHQLLSVPFALYSTQAGAIAPGNFINPNQISQNGALLNQVLKWNGSSWQPAKDEFKDGDTSEINEIQTLSIIDGRIFLSLNGGYIFLPDSSSTNELQSLTKSGKWVSLSQGGGTFSINDADSSPINELQYINRI